jgi:hypothetical protein
MSVRLDDFFGHFLGASEEHHGVVAEEQFVIHAGIACRHAAFDEQYMVQISNVHGPPLPGPLVLRPKRSPNLAKFRHRRSKN